MQGCSDSFADRDLLQRRPYLYELLDEEQHGLHLDVLREGRGALVEVAGAVALPDEEAAKKRGPR